jgi:hypothetical protein
LPETAKKRGASTVSKNPGAQIQPVLYLKRTAERQEGNDAGIGLILEKAVQATENTEVTEMTRFFA